MGVDPFCHRVKARRDAIVPLHPFLGKIYGRPKPFEFPVQRFGCRKNSFLEEQFVAWLRILKQSLEGTLLLNQYASLELSSAELEQFECVGWTSDADPLIEQPQTRGGRF